TGAADRRGEGEDARRAARRHQDGDAAQAQREGPRGRPRRGASEAGVRVPRERRGCDQDGDRRAAGRRAEGGVASRFVPGQRGILSRSLRTALRFESRPESTTAATSWIHCGGSWKRGPWGAFGPGGGGG